MLGHGEEEGGDVSAKQDGWGGRRGEGGLRNDG